MSMLNEAEGDSNVADGDPAQGIGNLEDDFVIAALDGVTGFAAVSSEGAETDGGDDLTPSCDGSALHEEEPASEPQLPRLRPVRPLDEAFAALAVEYDNEQIGELDTGTACPIGPRPGLQATMRMFTGGAAEAAAPNRADGAECLSDDDEDDAEVEGKRALQVTRALLGLPPSERLRVRGDAVISASAPRAETVDNGTEDDQPTALVREAPAVRWDCETIVSTYSTTDNLPGVLEAGLAPARLRRDAAQQTARSAANPAHPPAVLVRLGKTGLPVDFLPTARPVAEAADSGGSSSSEDAGGGDAGNWRSQTRRKGESAEEKRARKAAVKGGRRDARAEKKATKTLFKKEFAATKPAHSAGAVPAGASVMPIQ